MQDYFTFSQTVKESINQNLASLLREHLTGSKKLELIADGDSHDIYQVGQLDSGLYVALRENRALKELMSVEESFIPVAMYVYEDYCLKAESKHKAGKIVPRFSIGGMFGKIPFLLTEDMSCGKKHTLYSEYGGYFFNIVKEYRVRDGVKEEVCCDFGLHGVSGIASEDMDKLLDGDYAVESFKYFHPKNRLEI